jgi:hypothetical protein
MSSEVVGEGDLEVGAIDPADLAKDERASNKFLDRSANITNANS